MSDRKIIKDDDLIKVVGGLFEFNGYTNTMTYTHEDKSVTTHKVLDMNNAWKMSNDLHGKNWKEDDILNELVNKGYVK